MAMRVAVMGATGYTALELLKLLIRHPHVEIIALTTRQEGRPHVSDVHPELRGLLDLNLETLDVESLAERVDVVFSCLPHAASAKCVKPLVDSGLKVVDFSADYRLHEVGVYEQWYGGTHVDADRVGKVPYGLPELYRKDILGVSLVANPGCYPTSVILPLFPLLPLLFFFFSCEGAPAVPLPPLPPQLLQTSFDSGQEGQDAHTGGITSVFNM